MEPYYQSEQATIYCGDCYEVMRDMKESVDCVVTSPPYDNLRTYRGYNFAFELIADAIAAIIKSGGIICWNVGDSMIDGSESLTSFKQALYFKECCGLNVHDTMIYEKSNSSRPVNTRYNQCFEYIFVLSKGSPKTFNAIRDKKNVTAGQTCYGKHTMRERDGSMSVRSNRKVAAEYGMRGNVWKCNTAGQELCCESLPHPAMMPYGLCRDLVISWSNPGDIALDPMMGSGTTGIACVKEGRRFLGIDVSEEYCEMAAKRIKDAEAQLRLALV